MREVNLNCENKVKLVLVFEYEMKSLLNYFLYFKLQNIV